MDRTLSDTQANLRCYRIKQIDEKRHHKIVHFDRPKLCPNNIPSTSKHNEMTKQQQKNVEQQLSLPEYGHTPSIVTLIDDDDDEQPVVM